MVQIDAVDQISTEQLDDIFNNFIDSNEYTKYKENLAYFKANNPTILSRPVPDDSGPDNRIPIAYGRTIVNRVAGYMYKPGLVQYNTQAEAPNKPFYDALADVFKQNKEPIKTEQLGKQTGIQGVAYEYHYIAGQEDSKLGVKAVPRFCKLPAMQVIPIYDWAVDPELWAFIYFYERDDGYHVTVYYADHWDEYRVEKDEAGEKSRTWQLIDSKPHFYDAVPLVVYRNNEEQLGDIDAVQALIDAYDTLVSDSMNEFDRFAWAYLIVKGMTLSPEDAEAIKRRRIIEGLEDEDAIKFLTKEIDTEFIKHMTETIRQEIHRQSGIPNIEDFKFGTAASGATLDKYIYLMELYTDPKESYFRTGLEQRIDLIATILQKRDGIAGSSEDVDIVMTRNTPDTSMLQGQLNQLYRGDVSRETRLGQFADFVDDPQAEIERLMAEQETYQSTFFDVDNAEEPEDDAESE